MVSRVLWRDPTHPYKTPRENRNGKEIQRDTSVSAQSCLSYTPFICHSLSSLETLQTSPFRRDIFSLAALEALKEANPHKWVGIKNIILGAALVFWLLGFKALDMKIKRKGTVHPSPSSSSSCSSSYKDAISVFKLLPATILALASALSVDDREVLAYMITRSLTTANPSSIVEEQKKKCKAVQNVRKLPLFECGCFDCYTSFWLRWDSSPDCELIHQAIEAFEDQLATAELPRKNGRGRKRDKAAGRRDAERPANTLEENPTEPLPNDIVLGPKVEVSGENEEYCGGAESTEGLDMEALPAWVPASHSKGLARKVLPDVMGLLNSRLWSLWSPNI